MIEAQAAPVIPMPQPRDLSRVDPPAIPMVDNADIAERPDPSSPMADYAGASGMKPEATGRPETPGTRHGIGGRIKDFLEAALYGAANAHPGQGLMGGLGAGIAAAVKPGALAQYKWNNFEQPRIDERDDREARLSSLKQQSELRRAQMEKAQSDTAEDAQMRPYRQRQMVAQTDLAEANAFHARRPQASPRQPLEKIDTDQGPMRWNPITQQAEPILGANGQPVGRYEKPVAPKSDLPERHFAYQVDRDSMKDAQEQDKEARGIASDFEKAKKAVTALDTEKNELWKATGQKPNAKGMISYKGRDYSPAELSSMAEQKDAEWQAAQAEFSGHKQRASQHPGLELDSSGVGIRFETGRPQATEQGGKVAGGKVPVLTAAAAQVAAQRKGMSPVQFRQWFASQGGVIQ